MQIDLGNKKVTIKPWKTNTKKEFLNLIKNKGENVTQEEIMDVLLYPYIEESDIFLNRYELEYVLVNIRNISIKANIEMTVSCDICKTSFEISENVLEFTDYRKANYNGKWKDLSSKNSNKTITSLAEKYGENESDIEMLLHLSEINSKKVESFEDVYNIFSEMTLDELENLYEEYDKVKPYLEMKITKKCPHCGSNNIFYFDEIPSFFDPLLPKEIRVK